MDREQEQVFLGWMEQHKGIMLKVVYSFCDNAADQNDLFQEILVHLWSSIPSFEGRAKETTWIYRVALNTALTWERSEKKRLSRQLLLLDAERVPEARDERMGAQEMLDKIYAGIRKLPGPEASLILLSLDGLSYAEMSEITGLSESNVGVRLNRIRKKLTQTVKGADDEL